MTDEQMRKHECWKCRKIFPEDEIDWIYEDWICEDCADDIADGE